ncbi:alkaline phosphatase [Flectobacillus roseus]
MKKVLLFSILCCLGNVIFAQNYTLKNAHSHNDYEHQQPFYQAFGLGFGSIEADVYLQKDEIFVSHEVKDIHPSRTFRKLYLEPILREASINSNGIRPFQLLIDLKTEGVSTLTALQKQLQPYRQYFDRKNNPNAIQIVVSGERPAPSTWAQFDEIFYFDGRDNETYPTDLQWRVPMISASFRDFSKWNGLGRLPANEYKRLEAFVSKWHAAQKTVRFWGAPDNRTAYISFIKLGMDWIGTDHLEQLSEYLQKLPNNLSLVKPTHEAYYPTFKSDGIQKKSKNVILLIGDGMGIAQIYAGFTGNKGDLNVFRMKQIGLSKTSSADNYNTDSAAGATAMATGQKTNNRYLSVDTKGDSIATLPEVLNRYKIPSGVVVAEEITGATPAGFYAHQPERSWSSEIIKDLLKSPIKLAIGGGNTLISEAQKKANPSTLFLNDLSQLNPANPSKAIVLVQDSLVKPKQKGRGEYLSQAFDKAIAQLSTSKDGFFLMVEGSQIDHGGHANQLPFVVDEMIDFDKVIGKAMAFADKNGETTIIVTADHETGGLTLHDGNFMTGKLEGSFATPDHTGIPVMVFSYGPNSTLFQGFYENNTIFNKILQCFGKGK